MLLRWDSWWTRGLLLFGGVLALAISGGELYRDWQFTRDAHAIRGTVATKNVRTASARRSGSGTRSRTQHYEVSYRFTVDDRSFEGHDELREDKWRQLTEGGPVDVLYLPNAPSSNRLALSNRWVSDAIVGLIGIVLTSVGAITTIRATRRLRPAVSLAVVLSLSTSTSVIGLQQPTSGDAAYDKGAALAVAGQLKEARAVFEAAAKQDPGDSAVAAALTMLRDVDGGRVPADAIQRIFRAMDLAIGAKWKEAFAAADEAIKLAPRYARAHTTKAALFTSQRDYAQAIKLLDAALALDPQFAEGFYNRGAVRAEMKQIDAAIADYNRAVALEPTFWETYRNRGSAHTHKNDPKAAIADFTKALELRPQDIDTRLLRAVVEEATGLWDAALADLTLIIEREPHNATALYHRGLAYEQKGDLVHARADFTVAMKYDTTGEVRVAARQRLATLGRSK